MATARSKDSKSPKTRRPPATTPEVREQQLVSLTMDVVERELRDGTASSQIKMHFLKMGSTRENLEQERLRRENQILEAKREAMESQKRVEELYSEAMQAFRTYSGQPSLDDEGDDYDN